MMRTWTVLLVVFGILSPAWAAPAVEQPPATASEDAPEAFNDPDDTSIAPGSSAAMVDPHDATRIGLSTFAAGTLALVGTECLGLVGFAGGSVVFVLFAAGALATGALPLLLGFVGAYVGLLGTLCGFGPASALVSAGGAAAMAENVHRNGLPFFLGAIPGVAVGVIGGIIAGASFIAIGPVGYLTQGLALFAGSVEGLPLELLVGFALQTLAGPIALAGAFGAAYFFGDAFDEAVAEESVELKATPSVVQRRQLPLAFPQRPSVAMRY